VPVVRRIDEEAFMKVVVDEEMCISSGQCVLAVPEVFDQRDDDGIAFTLGDEPPAGLADDVRRAAAACPALAIRVED
jgi:ferredoxin